MDRHVCAAIASATLAIFPTLARSYDLDLGPFGHACDTCGGGVFGGLPRSPVPVSPIPLPAPIQAEVDKFGKDALRSVEKLGDDVLSTFQNAEGDTLRTLQKAGGDTVATIRKAGDDSIKTTYKTAGDVTATYVKAWRDIGEQGKRSFNDAIDAAKAASRFVENQAKSEITSIENADKRLRDGKVVDAMWGLAFRLRRAHTPRWTALKDRLDMSPAGHTQVTKSLPRVLGANKPSGLKMVGPVALLRFGAMGTGSDQNQAGPIAHLPRQSASRRITGYSPALGSQAHRLWMVWREV